MRKFSIAQEQQQKKQAAQEQAASVTAAAAKVSSTPTIPEEDPSEDFDLLNAPTAAVELGRPPTKAELKEMRKAEKQAKKDKKKEERRQKEAEKKLKKQQKGQKPVEEAVWIQETTSQSTDGVGAKTVGDTVNQVTDVSTSTGTGSSKMSSQQAIVTSHTLPLMVENEYLLPDADQRGGGSLQTAGGAKSQQLATTEDLYLAPTEPQDAVAGLYMPPAELADAGGDLYLAPKDVEDDDGEMCLIPSETATREAEMVATAAQQQDDVYLVPTDDHTAQLIAGTSAFTDIPAPPPPPMLSSDDILFVPAVEAPPPLDETMSQSSEEYDRKRRNEEQSRQSHISLDAALATYDVASASSQSSSVNTAGNGVDTDDRLSLIYEMDIDDDDDEVTKTEATRSPPPAGKTIPKPLVSRESEATLYEDMPEDKGSRVLSGAGDDMYELIPAEKNAAALPLPQASAQSTLLQPPNVPSGSRPASGIGVTPPPLPSRPTSEVPALPARTPSPNAGSPSLHHYNNFPAPVPPPPPMRTPSEDEGELYTDFDGQAPPPGPVKKNNTEGTGEMYMAMAPDPVEKQEVYSAPCDAQDVIYEGFEDAN